MSRDRRNQNLNEEIENLFDEVADGGRVDAKHHAMLDEIYRRMKKADREKSRKSFAYIDKILDNSCLHSVMKHGVREYTIENVVDPITLKNTGKLKCRECGVEFNASAIDEKKLKEAVSTIHNAIHQIISLSPYPEQNHERDTLTILANMDVNLVPLLETYPKIVNGKGKRVNDKHKNRRNDGPFLSGGYGGKL